MAKTDASTWALTAAAFACAVCGLLAWNSLEVQASDETLDPASQSLALKKAPDSYRYSGRSEIMLRAAGDVLN